MYYFQRLAAHADAPGLADSEKQRRLGRCGAGAQRDRPCQHETGHVSDRFQRPAADRVPGDVLELVVGARFANGVVWAVRPTGGDNLKAVAGTLDWPPLRLALRDFIDWVARWTKV